MKTLLYSFLFLGASLIGASGAVTISNIVNDPSETFSTFDVSEGGLTSNMRVDIAGGSATISASHNASPLGPLRLLVVTTQTVLKTLSVSQVGGTGTAISLGGSFVNVSPLEVTSDRILTVETNESGLIVGGGGSPPDSGTVFTGTTGGSGFLLYTSSDAPTLELTQPLPGNQFTVFYLYRNGTVIPEPSSVGLIALGMLSLVFRRKK